MTRLNTNLRRMAVVLASVIAVLGTLGGATASFLFQRNISERNESKARDERLRQERLAAYSSFAAAVMDLRGIQYDRGYSRMSAKDDQIDRSSIRLEFPSGVAGGKAAGYFAEVSVSWRDAGYSGGGRELGA
jgi:hypothetical protein